MTTNVEVTRKCYYCRGDIKYIHQAILDSEYNTYLNSIKKKNRNMICYNCFKAEYYNYDVTDKIDREENHEIFYVENDK
jgi:hypothetical protein